MNARTPSPPHAPRAAPSTPRLPRAALAVLAAVLAFALGAAWQYVGARQARTRLAASQQALTLARLDATLAGAVIAAQAGDAEQSRLRASEFFTGVQRHLLAQRGGTAAELQGLRRVLGQRDATITALARNDPASAGMLRRLLGEYESAPGVAAPPGPSPGPPASPR